MASGGLGWRNALDRVKGRRGRGPFSRLLLGAALRVWKLARLLPGAQRVRVTLPVAGHRMRVRLFSYDDLLTASPGYEQALADRLPRQGEVAIDAGAYIGRHTLEYARAVGPQGRVIAIEPLPDNFALLELNVRLNGYDRVVCVRCALGGESGEAALRYSRERSTATCDIERAEAAGQTQAVRVRQRTMDELLAELRIERIDFLKLDVEGAELSALMGAQRTLAASPTAVLLVELHGADEKTEPVRDWLRRHGFEPQPLADGARNFVVARQAPSR